jgi:spore coat polysaccharide biosynthesis protein SpsF
MTDHAMITVRAASSRLPEKCFLEFGGRSVLAHVIERCRHFEFEPIVATTCRDEDIMKLCSKLNVKCYGGSVRDKVARWLEACRRFNIVDFVSVDCDDPLFDPDLSRAVLQRVRTTTGAVVEPDLTAYLGSHGWAYTCDALEKICASKVSRDTEMVWHHFPTTLLVLKHDACPDPIEKTMRLTLDYEEDYWLLRTVVRELGPDARRNDIISFFKQNPGLSTVNLFRNVEWKQRQSE